MKMSTVMEQVKTSKSIDSRWLAGMTAWIYILSVVDGVLTIFWVTSNLAEEANPLMDELIMRDPVLFMIVKIVLVSLGTTLLWRLRERPLAVAGIFGCFLIYCTIFIHHIGAAGRLLIG
jgi:hypothetical protein